MKDSQLNRVIDLKWAGGGFLPANQAADDLADQLRNGEVVSFQEITKRDLSFHKNYMALLGYIWDFLPPKFRKAVPKDRFYQWLKHLKGQYNIIYKFNDGTTLIEYQSIAFGNMSEKRFHEYVKNQLPWIYEEVIGAFYEGEIMQNIIENIEADFHKFMDRL
ncbi:MAG: DUF1367 family protein [Parcubacteria group bacterium]|jgi:hypothetical protein